MLQIVLIKIIIIIIMLQIVGIDFMISMHFNVVDILGAMVCVLFIA